MQKSTKFAGIKINAVDTKIWNAITDVIEGDSYMTEMFNGSIPEDIQSQIIADQPHLKNNFPDNAAVIRDSLNDKRWGFIFNAGSYHIFMAPTEIIMELKNKGYCK